MIGNDLLGNDPLLPREPDVSDLKGLTIVKAEHLIGESDADEKVVLTFSNGYQLTVGTSEWLHVKILQPKAMPTKAGA